MQPQSQIEGDHNIVVQAVGSHVEVNKAGRSHLTLVRARKRPLKSELDLLYPQNRAFPIVGRQQVMNELWDWLDAEFRIAVRVISGGAGAGKTRTAIELMDRLTRERGEEWHAGFVTDQEMRRFGAAQNLSTWGWRKPTLIVVDYAAALLEPLWDWLRELADHGPAKRPLRILLLEREASAESGWLERLSGEGSYSDAGVADLFAPVKPLRLPALDRPHDRREILSRTIEAASEWREGETPSVPEPGDDVYFDKMLAEKTWADPLYLMMAALVSMQHGFTVALALSRRDLALRLAKRQLDRVRRFAGGHRDGSEADMAVHMAAYVTLCQGLSRRDAVAAAKAECEALALFEPGRAGVLVKNLERALPRDGGGVAAIKPDILGEAAVLIGLREANQTVLRAAGRASELVAKTVVLAAQDFSFEDPRDEQGKVWPEPLDWLERLVAAGEADEFGLLLAIDAAMPHHTVVLREQAASVTEAVLERLEAGVGSVAAEVLDAERARLANNLANRLSDLGRREEALERAEEAVGIRRKLAEARPDAFLPDLATSLNNVATFLSAVGRREEALERAEEAAGIYRKLAEARPDAFLPDLAMSLNNVANRLSEVGRREEALERAEEAVGIYRKLAEARPDAFLPDLAMSLNNVANRLSEVGRREEALERAEEAGRIYRKLAEARPDAFLPDLAMSLNNVANCLSDLGRREEALERAEEAVGIRRKLAEARPDAFLPDLATSLNNVANRLSEVGRREEALERAEEAVGIYRKLAKARPDAFLPDLATSLNNVATFLSAVGRREAALERAEEAVGIRRKLAEARPDAFLPYLATSLNNVANRLSEVGRREEALERAEEAVGIYRKLAEARPDAFLPDLATSLNNVANRLSEVGRREEALERAEEAVGIRRKLAEARPDAFLPYLATSLNNVAAFLSEVGRREEALERAEEAVGIRRKLAEARPEAFLPDLAMSLGAMGSVLKKMERHAEAADTFGEGVRSITPLFLELPAGFAQLTMTLCRDYLEQCQQAQQEPDLEILAPVLEMLQQLQQPQGDEEDKE